MRLHSSLSILTSIYLDWTGSMHVFAAKVGPLVNVLQPKLDPKVSPLSAIWVHVLLLNLDPQSMFCSQN